MAEASFHGVFPYVVSPLHPAGEVNAPVLARLCDDLIKAGVHGLTPLGSTGEFAYLERLAFRETVLAPASPSSSSAREAVVEVIAFADGGAGEGRRV